MPPSDHRISVPQYHLMIEAGILTEEDPVELLDGRLALKVKEGPRHDNTISRLLRSFNRLLGPEWLVRCKSGMTTAESEPEPDVAVVRRPNEQYKVRHPGPTDVALIVEVADVSLTHDRTMKARVYARAGLAEYWIVDLKDSVVEVYRDPSGPPDEPSYAPPQVFRPGQSITPLALDINVPVDSLF